MRLFLPLLICAFIVFVEASERGFQFGWQPWAFANHFFAQPFPDDVPEIAIDGSFPCHRIIGNWHARDFGDAALNRID